jgi:hypothetical protein
LITVLDPRIGYEGLKHQASQDNDLLRREDYLKQINDAVESLKGYYHENYSLAATVPSFTADGTPRLSNTPKPFDFFAIYASSATTTSAADELDQYLLIRPLGFSKGTPNPIIWWKCNRHLYPNTARLARDILSIPGRFFRCQSVKLAYQISSGSSVAVERVFSGGRDTISLRRSSLKPSTIRRLMLVKHRLLLARRQYVLNLEKEAKEAFVCM